MLNIGHAGDEFLTLAESFLDWGVNVESYPGGFYQMEFPPSRSLETFSCILHDNGARLVRTSQSISSVSLLHYHEGSLKFYRSVEEIDSQKNFNIESLPAFVCSDCNSKTYKLITTAVEKGANLLLLKPTHLGRGLVEEATAFYEYITNQFNITDAVQTTTLFQEFSPSNSYGKIIIVDGHFITDSGTKHDNYREIVNDIAARLLKFNIPVSSLQQISNTMVVPLNASLYIEWILTYWGKEQGEIRVDIEVDSTIEPESPLNFAFSNLSYGTKRTIGFWFSPKATGHFEDAILIQTAEPFPQKIGITLNVFSNYKQKLEGQSIAKTILIDQLKRVKVKFTDEKELDKFISLIDIDPRAAIIKARYLGETIAKKICHHIGLSTKRLNFDKIGKLISDKKLLSKKGIGYLNTIRIIGNLAAHAEEEDKLEFKEEDALITGQAIIEILEETFTKNLI